jgi:hypothetical protein
VGAAAGAAIGSAAGAVGGGAAVGGALGLLAGSAIGGSNAQASAGQLQQHYDIAYTQCMVAHGNSVQQSPQVVGYGAPYGYYGGPVVVQGGFGYRPYYRHYHYW